MRTKRRSLFSRVALACAVLLCLQTVDICLCPPASAACEPASCCNQHVVQEAHGAAPAIAGAPCCRSAVRPPALNLEKTARRRTPPAMTTQVPLITPLPTFLTSTPQNLS